jgi:hypothetical protein
VTIRTSEDHKDQFIYHKPRLTTSVHVHYKIIFYSNIDLSVTPQSMQSPCRFIVPPHFLHSLFSKTGSQWSLQSVQISSKTTEAPQQLDITKLDVASHIIS